MTSFQRCRAGQLFLFALSLCLATNVFAQTDTLRIPYKPTCASCRVVLEKVATFGDPSDPVLLKMTSFVDVDSRGQFYAPSIDGGQIVLFDTRGKFLRAFGRKGDGPGEFQGVSGISAIFVGKGDTIYVRDAAGIQVFAPMFRFVRRVPASGFRIFPLDGRKFLSAGVGRAAGSVGLTLHIMDSSNAIIRSFGPEHKEGPGVAPPPILSVELSADKNSVWMRRGIDLQQWSLNGQRLRYLTVTGVPWLGTPGQRAPAARGVTAPGVAPSVNFIGVDSVGLVWLNGMIPRPAGTFEDKPWDFFGRFTYTLEVIDPKAGTLLLSQPASTTMRFVGKNSMALSASMNPDEVVTYTAWRLQLVR